ncbi:phage tail sheath subtilisin-like domain-containing protein [Mesorhizobium sp. WSM2239]|uniref:Phage tail sheath subtilisin-like domain-containing protein n=2 Tax=unclassified Mesorhizobium TaxID=325217 RepID=A0AAU8D4H3_9HYPH
MAQSIKGVSTSVAAFVGYTNEGPVNDPVRILSLADFEGTFGPTDPASGLSYSVAHFFLNGGAEAWIARVVGAGNAADPSAAEIIGSQHDKSGMFALDKVDLFNLLIIPDRSEPAVRSAMIAYAERRRAFAILDLPGEIDTLAEAKSWISHNGASRHANSAAYFPRILAQDPAQGGQVRSFANSGAIAGVYARVDQQRGVWKAPAGTEAAIRGVAGLGYGLTDADQGEINPLGLNALRNFPIHGNVVWGSRTLAGADTLASEWKYIPVRRTALFVEECLYRGLQWAAIEPNSEPLWAQIRLSAGAFMHGLFQQGAFRGVTAKQAYIVKCDRETTTQADIESGLLIVEIGFAPLKPAEFEWLHIKIQMTE